MGGFVHFVINLCQRPDTQGYAGRICWCSWHTCRAKPIQSRWNEPDFRAANWSLLEFLLGILSSANLSSFRWGDLLLWKDLDLQQMPSMNHLQCFLCLKRQWLSSKTTGKVKLKLKWEVLAVFSSQGEIPNLQNIMFHSTLQHWVFWRTGCSKNADPDICSAEKLSVQQKNLCGIPFHLHLHLQYQSSIKPELIEVYIKWTIRDN